MWWAIGILFVVFSYLTAISLCKAAAKDDIRNGRK
jgi:hypothetical protein